MMLNTRISHIFSSITLTTFILLSPPTSLLLAQQDGAKQIELLTGAEMIPQNVFMTVSLTTNPEQWQQLGEFGNPKSQSALNRQLAQIRDRLLTANGFNYTKDIQPWIGKEITVAFLASPALPPLPKSPKRSGAAPQPQNVVMVLPVQDREKAKQLFEQLKPQATRKLVERTYQGFQIKEIQEKSQSYSTALVDDKFLVVSTTPKALDQVIETYQGRTALATIPGFTQALGKIQAPQSFGKLYINLPGAAAIASTNSGKPGSSVKRTQASENQGLAATVTLESEGVRLRSISWLKPDSQTQYNVQNTAGMMPARLPAETIIMASGGNFRQFWQDYGQTLGANPLLPVNPRTLETDLRSRLGMNWKQDFLSWMEGEFALALVNAPKGSPLPLGILFMVQVSDRPAAEKSLKQLDRAMATRYKFKVQESVIGSQPITNWILPKGGPRITHGWIDSNVAFLNFGAPLVNTILPKPTMSLTDSQPFKRGVSLELIPNNGHFFVNMERVLGGTFPLLSLPPATREVVSAIRAIGVTAAISDERSTRYDVLVTLQKAGRSASSPSPK